jgi:hypothetical protein
MSRQKPPSHRPERKLDDIAKAIARAREPDRVDKPTGARLPADVVPKRSKFHRGKGGGRQGPGGSSPSPSTKRPKQPGN